MYLYTYIIVYTYICIYIYKYIFTHFGVVCLKRQGRSNQNMRGRAWVLSCRSYWNLAGSALYVWGLHVTSSRFELCVIAALIQLGSHMHTGSFQLLSRAGSTSPLMIVKSRCHHAARLPLAPMLPICSWCSPFFAACSCYASLQELLTGTMLTRTHQGDRHSVPSLQGLFEPDALLHWKHLALDD